jgi:hypothetical protein
VGVKSRRRSSVRQVGGSIRKGGVGSNTWPLEPVARRGLYFPIARRPLHPSRSAELAINRRTDGASPSGELTAEKLTAIEFGTQFRHQSEFHLVE